MMLYKQCCRLRFIDKNLWFFVVVRCCRRTWCKAERTTCVIHEHCRFAYFHCLRFRPNRFSHLLLLLPPSSTSFSFSSSSFPQTTEWNNERGSKTMLLRVADWRASVVRSHRNRWIGCKRVDSFSEKGRATPIRNICTAKRSVEQSIKSTPTA